MLPHQPFPATPARSHRPQTIALQVDDLGNGRYRLSTPHARGWAAQASNPVTLARALMAAFCEVEVAAYSRQRGNAYDLDVLTVQVPGDPLASAPQARQRRATSAARTSRKRYPPENWEQLADDSGRWRSPSGRVYRADTRIVRDVKARRAALGLHS